MRIMIDNEDYKELVKIIEKYLTNIRVDNWDFIKGTIVLPDSSKILNDILNFLDIEIRR